jgi:ABC-type antimicrobial peptide transport system permease subunit
MKSRDRRPPRLMALGLTRLLDGAVRGDAADDFEEKFAWLAQERGRGVALAWYLGQIAYLVPIAVKDSLYWSAVMFQNYAVIALRNVRKHKAYSLINVAGLAIGIAVSLFIFLWIRDELSFDRFHADYRNIYRLTEDQKGADGTIFPVAVTPELLGGGLKADFPEVLEFARFRPMGRNLVAAGEKRFYENGLAFADPAFLRMFSFPLIKGDPATALAGLESVVITESTARKYFGDEDPMGQTLRLADALDFKVTGVARDVPRNSHIQFGILGNFDFVMKKLGFGGGWWNNNFYTYVQLAPTADLAKLSPAVEKYLTKISPKAKTAIRLQPLRDVHLRSNYAIDIGGATHVQAQYVAIFAGVALAVLLIACINYMNLATARAGLRSREVGVRKVIGAGRAEIMRQFFGESLFFAAVSCLVAAGLVRILLPQFNKLTGKAVTPAALLDPMIILFLSGTALAAGLLSGVYPALFMSAFRPVSIFRGGSLTGTKSALFRKSLVVLQFGLSTVFIAGTLVVASQLRYMRAKNLGYDRDSVVHFRLRGDLAKNYQAFKDELSQAAGILGVTSSSDIPTYTVHSTTDFSWQGQAAGDYLLVHQFTVDYENIETLGMEMARGRSFSRDFPTDKDAFIVNEAAARRMGFNDPLGQWVRLYDRKGPIVGVVKDFNFKSLHTPVEPLVLRIEPQGNSYVLVKTRFGDLAAGLETIRRVHAKYNPRHPLDYEFLDDSLGALYRSDRRFGAIAGVFTGLAIFISALGLFGLASFLIERRTKEIGIRKILGADTGRIVALLSRDFLRWVAAANVIAVPVAAYAMSRWLQSFAYRTSLSVWVFAAAAGLAIGIAMLTISVHCVRAAAANPAHSLRTE